MKRRLAVAVLVGVVFAGCFAAAAWAIKVGYAPSGATLYPGQGYRTGWTGLGWTENYMQWTDPNGGTPNMCSNYEDTSGNKLLSPDKCSGSGIVDDTRHESNYAAAVCWSSNSNNYPVKLSNAWNGYGCWAIHN
jgi:hypothetical protein